MKKHLLTILFCLLLAAGIDCSALSVYNLMSKVTTEKDSVASPKLDVSVQNGEYYVTFELEEVELSPDEVYSGRKFVNIPGFGQTDVTKKPSLPTMGTTFLLPKGKLPVIDILQTAYVDYAVSLAPARPPLPQSSTEQYNKSNVPEITYYSGYNTEPLVELASRYMYRGEEIMNISITPAKYSVASKNVRLYKKIRFKISFADAPESEAYSSFNINFNNSNLDHFWNQCQVLDPDETLLFQYTDISEDYLIITVPDYEPAAQTFVDWKKQEGYKCSIVSEENWTVEDVKDAVKSFASHHPNFAALLILGDVGDIPTCNVDAPKVLNLSLKTYGSDLPYACLDGEDDNFPDILYGRIPATTVEEAEGAIKKIVEYESCYVKASLGWQKPTVQNSVHVAYFEARENDNTVEDREFIRTSETILAALSKLGGKCTRVYFASPDDNPTWYKDGRTQMPDEIKKPGFDWNGTASDIISAINGKRPGYVLYRGHGSWDGWGHPSFRINDLTSLTNKMWFPLVFSISCNTGQMYVSSFAKKFLTCSSTAGASGVLGASNVSYSGWNDDLAKAMFQSLYSKAEIHPAYQRIVGADESYDWCTVGDAIQSGLRYMKSLHANETWGLNDYQYKVFHWFGDPTMRMYTETPQFINNIGLSVSLASIDVFTVDKDVRITAIYRSGNVMTQIGPHANLPYTGCDYLVITGRNKVPKTLSLSDFTDNQRNASIGSYLKSAILQNNELRVNYHFYDNDLPIYVDTTQASGTLTVTSLSGQLMGTYSCPFGKDNATFDCSSYPKGTYVVSLRFYNVDCGSATVIKH